MTKLFPIFLLLKGKRALIYGRDSHSVNRIGQLLETGADVHLIYPDLSGLKFQHLQKNDKEPKFDFKQGHLCEKDIENSDIVFADQTLSPNEFSWIIKHKKLFHQLDELVNTDFYLGSVVDYGPIRIAVSSNGRFPWLPRFLRELLNQVFAKDGELFLIKVAELRDRIKMFFPDQEKRSIQIKRLTTHLETIFRLEPIKGKE